jgi:PHD/YefM family antitoxin component YafN of YafNO toxin-antitoxin module
MIATQHTQSLTAFRQKATETLDRLNETGDAEILTVNGQARAVLLSPVVYDELTREALLTHDASVIRRAVRQIEGGKGRDAADVFDALRKELLAKKKKQDADR